MNCRAARAPYTAPSLLINCTLLNERPAGSKAELINCGIVLFFWLLERRQQ